MEIKQEGPKQPSDPSDRQHEHLDVRFRQVPLAHREEIDAGKEEVAPPHMVHVYLRLALIQRLLNLGDGAGEEVSSSIERRVRS